MDTFIGPEKGKWLVEYGKEKCQALTRSTNLKKLLGQEKLFKKKKFTVEQQDQQENILIL